MAGLVDSIKKFCVNSRLAYFATPCVDEEFLACFCYFLGHGIETTRMPRLAFGDAPRAQVSALRCTVRLHGFEGVFRTAWEESAALPEHRANAVAIAFDQRDQCAFTGGVDGASGCTCVFGH